MTTQPTDQGDNMDDQTTPTSSRTVEHTEYLHIRCSKDLVTKARGLAAARGESVSEMVRKMIRDGAKRQRL